MAQSSFDRSLSKILVIVLVVVVAAVVFQLYKAAQQGGKAVGQMLGEQVVYKQTGVLPARQKFLRGIAQQIRNAITIVPVVDSIIWISDDEVVAALNQVEAAAEVALVSQYFTELCGKSLASDVVNNTGYFTASSKKKIKPLLLQNLV